MTPPSYDELLAENARLRELVERQRQKIERQEMTILSLQQQIRLLKEKFDELQRQQKRQAAPFSKGPPKADPKPPGRKPGDAYGKKAFRAPPQPAEITESYDVPVPETCPHCGSGEVHETHTAEQFQVDLPRQPIVRRFHLHIGRCCECGKRVQPRHALQTSNALGAARSQLGPVLQAFLTVLQKQLGLAHGKCVRLLQTVWGIRLTRGGVVQELLRTPRRNPDNARLRKFLRRNLSALLTFLKCFGVDATSWRAEQALRPAVVNRKVWGGNRTPLGALVQSVLMTVLATLERRTRPVLETLSRTLRQGHLRLRFAG